MSILAFLGLIALIVGMFYWPVPIAFTILTIFAFEQLGLFAAICVIIGAVIYSMWKYPDEWLNFLNDVFTDDNDYNL